MQQLVQALLQGSDRTASVLAPKGGAVPSRFRFLVAKSPSQLQQLQSGIEDFLRRQNLSDEVTLTLAYFLARVREKKTLPFLVAVYENEELVGVAYGMRHCLLNVPVGVFEFGDSCGDASIIALDHCFREVVDAALAAISQQRRLWLARISWNTGSSPLGAAAWEHKNPSGMSTRAFGLDVWNLLRLTPDYEVFLSKMGSQTRHNLRYYRRRVERLGWAFVKDLNFEQGSAAFKSLHPFQSAGFSKRTRLDSYLQTIRDVPGSFFSGLRTQEGEWMSVVCGWVKGSRMFILLQVNSTRDAKASVSTVLRSYIIENAIKSGIRDIKVIDGCGGILRKYTQVPSSHLLMQKDGYFGRLFGRAICRLFPSSTFSRLLSEASAITSTRTDTPPESALTTAASG